MICSTIPGNYLEIWENAVKNKGEILSRILEQQKPQGHIKYNDRKSIIPVCTKVPDNNKVCILLRKAGFETYSYGLYEDCRIFISDPVNTSLDLMVGNIFADGTVHIYVDDSLSLEIREKLTTIFPDLKEILKPRS